MMNKHHFEVLHDRQLSSVFKTRKGDLPLHVGELRDHERRVEGGLEQVVVLNLIRHLLIRVTVEAVRRIPEPGLLKRAIISVSGT